MRIGISKKTLDFLVLCMVHCGRLPKWWEVKLEHMRMGSEWNI